MEEKKESHFVKFVEEVERAIGDSEIALIRKVRKHNSWQSAMVMLERRFPERWGRKFIRVEASGPDGGPIPVDATVTGNIGVQIEGLQEILAEQAAQKEQPAPEAE
jgi:hypothetical protein